MLTSFPALAQTSAAPADHGRAAERLAIARKLHQQQKLDEALVAYLEAWALEKRYDVAANLGKLELELGRARDAAEHLNYAVTNLPSDVDPKTRGLLEASMQAARAKVASVRIALEPSNAGLMVDGQKAELLPGVTEVFVEPGTRVFEARLDGYEKVAQRLDTVAGGNYGVHFALKRSASPTTATGAVAPDSAPSATREADTAAAEPKSRSMLPVFIGGGIALAAIGAGIGFTVAANGKESDRQVLLDGLVHRTTQKYPCDPGLPNTPSECNEASDLLDDEERFRNFGVGAFVVGGVAAVATAAYWLFWPDPAKAGAGMVLVPVAGSNGSRGLSLSAKF